MPIFPPFVEITLENQPIPIFHHTQPIIQSILSLPMIGEKITMGRIVNLALSSHTMPIKLSIIFGSILIGVYAFPMHEPILHLSFINRPSTKLYLTLSVQCASRKPSLCYKTSFLTVLPNTVDHSSPKLPLVHISVAECILSCSFDHALLE